MLAAIVEAPLALAFGAGMLAAVNPCGFAMLPAYLSYFCGLEGTLQDGDVTGEDASAAGLRAVPRALSVTAVMTAGFVTVFGLVGLAVTQLSSSILDHAKWATIVVGVGLVGLGIALLAGRELTVRLPHLDRGGNSRELSSMLLFGISYAIASLSCTLPAFLATTSSTFNRSGTVAGLATFVAYGLGMGLIVGGLTLAVALARVGVVRTLRGVSRYVNRVSGALVLLAGLYIAYYGVYEVRLARLGPGDSPADPVVDRALRIQEMLSDWIGDVGTARLGLACGLLVGAGLAVAWGLRRDRAAGMR
jgi:cytochrome c biogenesis protein CcdA